MKAPNSAIRLVVNADGFAGDAAITRGTLRAHREGIVTSTSVIGNCADPSAVRAELATVPALGVGVHLTLTGGTPIAPPSTIRSLLGSDEQFPSQVRDVFLSWAKAAPRGDEIEREFDAQVAHLRDAAWPSTTSALSSRGLSARGGPRRRNGGAPPRHRRRAHGGGTSHPGLVHRSPAQPDHRGPFQPGLVQPTADGYSAPRTDELGLL